jgi:hypothetical protein
MTDLLPYFLLAIFAAGCTGAAIRSLKHAGIMRLLIRSLTVALAVLRLFAGPYRVIAFKSRTFGGIGQGFATWLGVALVFPVSVAAFSPDGYVPWPVWLALVIITYAKMTVQWCSTLPPRDENALHFRLPTGELVFACLASYVASILCGPGGFVFFIAGYIASLADYLLRRIRSRCQDWTPEDTARLLLPFHTIMSQAKRSTAVSARFTLRHGLLLATATGTLLANLWRLFRERRQKAVYQPTPSGFGMAGQPTPSGFGMAGQPPPNAFAMAGQPSPMYYRRPPTFLGRVMSHIVASTLIMTLTSVIGFNIFALILAVPLWIMGWHVAIPGQMKEHAREVMHNVRESFDDGKDEMIDRLREKREAIKERFGDAREEFKERLDDKKEEIADRIERGKRRALWNYFTK